MDITNCRSMELFNRLGISQGLREQGVDQNFSFDVIASTGLSDGGECIAKWDLPSPDAWRAIMKAHNDGSLPREPYQRCSQVMFEAWLKPRIKVEPHIDSHFGLEFESLIEVEDAVESTLTNSITGETHIVSSQYVVGCDGAGSRVRKAIRAELIGGSFSVALLLVHFKSRDLSILQKQGQFWHIFFTSGGTVIAQDEVDTWTVHKPIPLDADWQKLDPEEAIYEVLGGSISPCPIKVDQILVTSCWRPNISIADRYISSSGRIFIAGDAAHQIVPTGGYGMNTAIGDSFDIGWKLAAVLHGYGGKHLLYAYEKERMPVAVRNIERSMVHWNVLDEFDQIAQNAGSHTLSSASEEGKQLRARIAEYFLSHDGENKDQGIEMDYRYNKSPIVVPDLEALEPSWSPRRYTPSTWPGARVPHVFLADGNTSIYDKFGRGYTIVDFSKDGHWATEFAKVAARQKVPLRTVRLPQEKHAAQIWERNAVLVRPDDHVAWRAPANSDAHVSVEEILKIATGRDGINIQLNDANNDLLEAIRCYDFTSPVTVSNFL
ncbi:hypothetical protein V502_02631 [Pseudogymnoascus sp. VKM F-4520 (FW-2644)]|nr:hypothetical protein V502_02631 [Pseudogymnoascus sp. VKM F-4520 (FW-2644)]